jgi:hypothetical protein
MAKRSDVIESHDMGTRTIDGLTVESIAQRAEQLPVPDACSECGKVI